jgi:hypothetical protein
MRAKKSSAAGALLLLGLLVLVIAASVWLAVWPLGLKPGPPKPERDHRDAPQFASSESAPRDSLSPRASAGFVDVAESSGLDFHMTFLAGEQGEHFKINLYDHGCGLAVADYDGDGHDDVLLLNQVGANALYRNQGDGRFDRVTDDGSPVAMSDRVCVAAAFGDYDNDGDQDLYITSTRGGNLLFANECGEFRDVTDEAGVAFIGHSQTPAFFDFDNDGDLDLYLTNVAKWTSDVFSETEHYFVGPRFLNEFLRGEQEDRERNVLFRNEGDGHFKDVTEQTGLRGLGWAGDVAVFDFDEDGSPDVFVTNMFGHSQLYQNDGRGHFRDVTKNALGKTSFGAIGAKAFDYDNDGRLDLFVSDMHSDMWSIPNTSSKVEANKKRSEVKGAWRRILNDRWGEDFANLFWFGNTLYHNAGAGAFVESSDAAGVETYWPWGVIAADFDNDGDQDVFLPSGMGYPFFYWPNALLMNDGHGHFDNRAEMLGIEPPRAGYYLPDKIGGKQATRSSRCAASGDFDGDGRVDLIVNNFNDVPYYFKNDLPSRHYVAFRLHGVRSNRDAVGAVVRLHLGEQVLLRQVDCSGGYLSQCSKTLHFGLHELERIGRAEIHWPSGVRQVVGPLKANALYELIEPIDDPG